MYMHCYMNSYLKHISTLPCTYECISVTTHTYWHTFCTFSLSFTVRSEATDNHSSDSPKEWKVLSVLFAMYLHRQLQRVFVTWKSEKFLIIIYIIHQLHIIVALLVAVLPPPLIAFHSLVSNRFHFLPTQARLVFKQWVRKQSQRRSGWKWGTIQSLFSTIMLDGQV